MMDSLLLSKADEVVKTAVPLKHKVRPTPGSPLEYVLNNVGPTHEEIVSTESVNLALSNVVDKCNTPFAFTGDPVLPMVIEAIEEQCINPLKNQLSFVRNVVNPVIREVYEDAEDSLKASASRKPEFHIVKLSIPDYVYNLRNYIATHAVSMAPNQVGPDFKPSFDRSLSKEDIIEIAKGSGTEDLATCLMQVSEKYQDLTGSDVFTDTWKEFVCAPNDKLGTLPITYTNFLKALVGFLVADSLVKNPIPNLGISQSQLNIWGTFFKAACARIIQINLSSFDNAIQSKALIENIDKANQTIYVYESTYAEFDVEDKVEVLIGILNTENHLPYRTLPKIQENREILANRGKFVLETNLRTEDNTKIARITDALVGSVIRLVERTQESEETSELRSFVETKKPAFEYRPVVLEFLRQYYPNSTLLKHDLKMVVADVICYCFFRDTMAATILRRFVLSEIEHPKATDAGVATAAIVDMIVEWVAGQIEVVPEGL